MRRSDFRSGRPLILSLLLGFYAALLSAHDTWVIPQRARLSAGADLVLDLTSGMAFPANETAIKPDRLARASLRLARQVSDLPPGSAGKGSLRIQTRVSQPGVATIWIESKPRTLELKPKEVREYLDEIGASESIGKKWEAEGSGRWRETYTKHAKTFVRVGEANADDSWREPVGMALELVPEKNPTDLRPGDELRVRVLRDGKPLPGLSVGVASAGDAKGTLRTSDSDGRTTFPLPRSGWWLLRATQLEKSSKPDVDWESHFATLTVFVTGKTGGRS
jgi:uncharacterized GH25 family protein